MLLVNYKAWNSQYILLALVVLTLFFALFMPHTQKSKNTFLYEGVVENNITKAKIWIEKGADIKLLLPKGYPLISLAIEYENEKMLKLLMLDKNNLSKTYKGYSIVEHAASKKNKKLLKMILEALTKKKNEIY